MRTDPESQTPSRPRRNRRNGEAVSGTPAPDAPQPTTTSESPAQDRFVVKHSPITGEKMGEFRITPADEVHAAVARARVALAAWRETPLEARLQMVSRIKGVILERGEDLARRLSADNGKPLVDALMTELMTVPLFVDYYRKKAPGVLARRKVRTPIIFPGKSSYVEYFPIGVVAIISPWNFPFQLSVIPALTALICGNTVVLKPSEVTPFTGEIIREVMEAIRLPDGVFQVVQGDGSTGAALCEADVDKIFFTGSVATGRRVMAEAAKKPIPVELELGGKDAMIVLRDANLRRAARAACWGGLINCGQMCISVERILVEDAVYDEFVAMLEREIARVRVGAPDEDSDMGPVTFPRQLETIERHVRTAVDAGARLLFGGHPLDRPGQFYAPTLLADVTPDMEVYREETFGPVLPVTRVRDVDEAIRLANDHQYGLNASVWTSRIDRGIEIASRLECGQVCVNDAVVSTGNPVLPFGGVKKSGFGRYHGPEGLVAFSHQRAIMVDRGLLNSEPFWFPYGGKYPHMLEVFRGLLSGNLPRALTGLFRLTRHTRQAGG